MDIYTIPDSIITSDSTPNVPTCIIQLDQIITLNPEKAAMNGVFIIPTNSGIQCYLLDHKAQMKLFGKPMDPELYLMLVQRRGQQTVSPEFVSSGAAYLLAGMTEELVVGPGLQNEIIQAAGIDSLLGLLLELKEQLSKALGVEVALVIEGTFIQIVIPDSITTQDSAPEGTTSSIDVNQIEKRIGEFLEIIQKFDTKIQNLDGDVSLLTFCITYFHIYDNLVKELMRQIRDKITRTMTICLSQMQLKNYGVYRMPSVGYAFYPLSLDLPGETDESKYKLLILRTLANELYARFKEAAEREKPLGECSVEFQEIIIDSIYMPNKGGFKNSAALYEVKSGGKTKGAILLDWLERQYLEAMYLHRRTRRGNVSPGDWLARGCALGRYNNVRKSLFDKLLLLGINEESFEWNTPES